MYYFYYVKWFANETCDMEKGFYHTTYRTTTCWEDFIKEFLPTKYLLVQTFESEEKLEEFEKTVGLFTGRHSEFDNPV